ncbi:MAG: hypothetical protein IJD02_00915 [Lachnospiraceae bacterium]|nr:hypothetical protein [Lachnospiraceae bacterium]
MKQKIIVKIMGAIVFLSLGALVGLWVFDYMAPSKERVDLQEIYNVPKGETKLFINDKEWDKNGIYIDGEVYVDYETVKKEFTENIYYDPNEKLVIVTTDKDNIHVNADSSLYTLNGVEKDFGKKIFTVKNNEIFLGLDFISDFGKVEYELYDNPSRAMIYSDFETEFLSAAVSEDTLVRVKGDKKSEIICDLKSGDKVHVKAEGMELAKGYVGVLTMDGVMGYVKEETVKDSVYEKMNTDYKEVEYESLTKDGKINLTWHAVYSEVGKGTINELLDNSPGVNVVSPTWFRLTDEEGNFSSIANKEYVEAAHNRNVEVWALISDVEKKIDTYNLFSHTKKRRVLIEGLINKVKEYNIDGINIDFETINSKSAPHYIQFLRELSVECRKEKIILSVDSYVPMAFNEFYRRDIQGKIVDYVVVMAYDEHYSGSAQSGSVSSISWVTNAVNNTKKKVPAGKIIIGIPFYARLWEEKRNTDGSIEIVSVQSLSMETANETVSKNSATIVYNEETGQDYAQYEKNGSVYKIWLENAKSIKNKLAAIKEGECGGVASWRAGFETEDIWEVINEEYMK